jgi:UDP-glucose 4-epimerase
VTTSRWLITGGAGYIGAHVVRAVLESGREAVVVDDLSTGVRERVPAGAPLITGSVVNTSFLSDVLRTIRPTGVLHLAGKKSPTQSMVNPVLYGRENVGGVISLAEAALAAGVQRVVFSSSCSVYGAPDAEIVGEEEPLLPQSPYGESKLYGERLLTAAARARGSGHINLRYFNVAGTAEPALRDTGAYNLIPLSVQALRSGRAPVFGADYPTPDGTCVRDYVHVADLAAAHVRAAEALETTSTIATYNVGRGRGDSVLQVLDALRRASGIDFTPEICERRAGDPAYIVGRTTVIEAELGWTAEHDLDDMVNSAWRATNRNG